MRYLAASLLLLLSACTLSEYQQVPDRDWYTPPLPPLIQDTWHTEEFIVGVVEEADILWVIDNSCSMHNKQQQIAIQGPLIMEAIKDSGINYHIGIVNTDNVSGSREGKLIDIDGLKWIDNAHLDPVSAFGSDIVVGINAVGREAGLDSSWMSVEYEGPYVDNNSDGIPDGYNCEYDEVGIRAGCFMRNDAGFHVVVVSDEPDQSEQTWQEYVTWMLSLKPSSSMVSLSIIGWGNTNNYKNVAGATGGVVADIYSNDWGIVVEDLASSFVGQRSKWPLRYVPVEETIDVSIIRGSTWFPFYPGECDQCFTYDRISNTITLHGFANEEGDILHVEYKDAI
jgi:hypothetical protein